jgi:predicted GNAT family acetyltransferase
MGVLFFYFMLELSTKPERVSQKPVASELSSLTETDQAQIIEIFLQTYYKYPLTVDQLKCFMGDPNTKVVTVKENGIIVAVGFLQIESEKYASITGVCCLPSHRGRGFGKKINEILIDLARKNNIANPY